MPTEAERAYRGIAQRASRYDGNRVGHAALTGLSDEDLADLKAEVVKNWPEFAESLEKSDVHSSPILRALMEQRLKPARGEGQPW